MVYRPKLHTPGPRPARKPRRQNKDRKTSAQRGYGYRWDNYAKVFRHRFATCIACIDTMSDTEFVDHIIPVRQDDAKPEQSGFRDDLFWMPWNHQPLCRHHHVQKTHCHDDWYRDNRGQLCHELIQKVARNEPEHEIRNWLIEQNRMWPDGWFDLNEDPELFMSVLSM